MLMAAFATYSDYVVLYDTALDETRVNALLAMASRDMARELDAAHVTYDQTDADYLADLCDVACSMVHRAIGDAGEDDEPLIPFGASQFSQGAGSYTRSATLANPYGDLFMTEAERRKLGIGLPRATVVSPWQPEVPA